VYDIHICFTEQCNHVFVCRKHILPLLSSSVRIQRRLFQLRSFRCLSVSSKHTRCVCDIYVFTCLYFFTLNVYNLISNKTVTFGRMGMLQRGQTLLNNIECCSDSCTVVDACGIQKL